MTRSAPGHRGRKLSWKGVSGINSFVLRLDFEITKVTRLLFPDKKLADTLKKKRKH